MSRAPKGYWEKRSTELLKDIEDKTLFTINDLIKAYNKATKDINNEIKKIYNKYATDSKLTKKEAMTLLSQQETNQFYKQLLEKIDKVTDDDIKQKLLAKYNAPAYAYRITRYQALQDNIDIELKKLAGIEKEITKIQYIDTITEGYYRNIFNIQKGLKAGFNFSQIDKRTIDLMLKNKWNNKANYSQRIWNNSERLSDYLRTSMIADTMTGKSIQKMASELNQAMETGLYNATRLVRTETNYFANQAEMLSYEECGIEEYQFIATLDHITCEHCTELDKRVFKVKEAKPGKNCPPIHPNDRCTTVAYFGEDDEELGRIAKNLETGESYYIKPNISYNEWKNQYVDNNKINDIKVDINSIITMSKQIKELKYVDVTEKILANFGTKKCKVIEQQFFEDENGNKYKIDNKDVKIKADKKEREVAELLGKIYGEEVKLVPVVLNPKGIQTPDYIVNGEKFDLKEIAGNGKNTLDTAISKKRRQSNNFIFDISKTEMNEEEAISQIERIYNSKNREWVNKIILIKQNKVIKIFERK